MTTALTVLPSAGQALVLVVALAAVVLALVAILQRPQRGLLLLAALVPFDGLLLLAPVAGVVNGWKEGLLLLTVGASAMSPNSVPLRRLQLPDWAVVAGALLLLALISAALVPPLQAGQAIKIGYFYVLIPIVVLRNPFTRRDIDNLVTILMAAGVITASYGIAQQALGGDRLAAMGYQYNETIRTAGGFLRSFSTFNQPFGFGLFVMMVLLIGGSVALSQPRRRRNALFLAACPILVLGMSVSIVRGAYLGLAVGVALLAAMRYRGLLLGVPLVVAVVINLPASVFGAVFSSSSLTQRSTGWSEIVNEILRHPLGIGIGTTGSVAEKVAELSGTRAPFYQPDSQYVKMLMELGIIGLWLLVLLVMTGLIYALTLSRRTTDPDSAFALGVSATILAAIGASTVSTYFEIFPMDVYFWLLLGVLTCLPTSGSTPSRSAPGEAVSRPISGNC